MRPSFVHLLELTRLRENFELTRLPSVGRNVLLFAGSEKGQKKKAQQVVFLRAISHSPDVANEVGAERALLGALDELERAMLDPRVTTTSSSRIMLNLLPRFSSEVGE